MITDAQASYLFSEGMLEGLQLLFQVNNLTNEPYIAYSEDKQRLLDYQEYGTASVQSSPRRSAGGGYFFAPHPCRQA